MKTKRVVKNINYLAIEYKQLEKYLESLAAKGLVLEKVKNYSLRGPQATFINTVPTQLRYSIDFNSSLNQDYLELCQSCGWEYVCDIYSLHVFKSNLLDLEPMQSDETIEDELIKTNVYRQEIWRLIKLALYNLGLSLFYSFAIFLQIADSQIKLITAIIITIIMYTGVIYSFVTIIHTYRLYQQGFYHHPKKVPLIKYGLIYPCTLSWLVNLLFLIVFSNGLLNQFIPMLLTALIIIFSIILLAWLKEKLSQ